MDNDRSSTDREYNGAYTGAFLDHIAFPLGGMGSGMICMEGTGALSHVSLRHAPGILEEPVMFAALSLTDFEMMRRRQWHTSCRWYCSSVRSR